ncbi:MAG: transcriptional regulator [Planctomycetes bacterium]|nr:transcriptional regulator [Planctomycetota bacterium]
MTRPRVRPHDLDPVVHDRVRLSILSVLSARDSIAYGELRHLLELTDGNIAAHLRTLEERGFIRVSKKIEDRRSKTTYRITAAGRKAFRKHIEQLASLLPDREEL